MTQQAQVDYESWLYHEVLEQLNQSELSQARPRYDPAIHGLLWQEQFSRMQKKDALVQYDNHHILYAMIHGRVCICGYEFNDTLSKFSCQAKQDSTDSVIEISSEEEKLLCSPTYTDLRSRNSLTGTFVGQAENSADLSVLVTSKHQHCTNNEQQQHSLLGQDSQLKDSFLMLGNAESVLGNNSVLQKVGQQKQVDDADLFLQQFLAGEIRPEDYYLESCEISLNDSLQHYEKQSKSNSLERSLVQGRSNFRKVDFSRSPKSSIVDQFSQNQQFSNARNLQQNQVRESSEPNKTQFLNKDELFLSQQFSSAIQLNTQYPSNSSGFNGFQNQLGSCQQTNCLNQSNSIFVDQIVDSQQLLSSSRNVLSFEKQDKNGQKNTARNQKSLTTDQSDLQFSNFMEELFNCNSTLDPQSSLDNIAYNVKDYGNNFSKGDTSGKISNCKNNIDINGNFITNYSSSNDINNQYPCTYPYPYPQYGANQCEEQQSEDAKKECEFYKQFCTLDNEAGGMCGTVMGQEYGSCSSAGGNISDFVESVYEGSSTDEGVIGYSSNQRRLEGDYGGICVRRARRLNSDDEYEWYSEDDNHGIRYEVAGWEKTPCVVHDSDEDDWLTPTQRYCIYCGDVFEFRNDDKLCEVCTRYYKMELSWTMLFGIKECIDSSDMDPSFSPHLGCAPWVEAVENTVDVQDSYIHVIFEVRPEFRDRLHEPELQQRYQNFMGYTVPYILYDSHEVFKGDNREFSPKWVTRCNLNVINLRKQNEWIVNFGCMWSYFMEPVTLNYRSNHPLSGRLQQRLAEVQKQPSFRSYIKTYIQDQIMHIEASISDYKPLIPDELFHDKRTCRDGNEMQNQSNQLAKTTFPILELGEQVVAKVLERCMRSDLIGFLNARIACKTFFRCCQQVACGELAVANQGGAAWDGLYGEQQMSGDTGLFFCYEALDKVYGEWYKSAFYLPLSLSQIPSTQYFVQRGLYHLELHPAGHDVCTQLAQALADEMSDVFQFYHKLSYSEDFGLLYGSVGGDEGEDIVDDDYTDSHWGSDSSFGSDGYLGDF